MFHKSASYSKEWLFEIRFMPPDQVILACAQCAPDSSLRRAGTPSVAIYNLRQKMARDVGEHQSNLFSSLPFTFINMY